MQKLTQNLEHGAFVFFILVGFFSMIDTSYALSNFKSFGGKITSTNSNSMVTCTGTGLLTIDKLAGKEFLIPPGTSVGNGKATNNALILGIYDTFKAPGGCFEQDGPYRRPYSTYRIKLYNVSGR